ncbi:MAG: hypothetical protein PHH59_07440 [Methylovulum sp.]|uniref:hypothetical protein n=1 Tax=Methylovulum sp. TaxID=1916980 RepID=UPI0026195818|nr:hypothetical protein [Methylovulum sp.]MDD2723842.1 hypothetical protein [Methylovulum sp.]MDD5123720.1 hypothetical protein [Methylovulum sp.]
MQTISDEQGNITGVIVPIDLWQKIQPQLGPDLLAAREKRPRPIGLAKGLWSVPPDFFEPLPDEILDAFEGK